MKMSFVICIVWPYYSKIKKWNVVLHCTESDVRADLIIMKGCQSSLFCLAKALKDLDWQTDWVLNKLTDLTHCKRKALELVMSEVLIVNTCFVKVEKLREGPKIWKNLLLVLTKQLFLLSSVKTSRRFFQLWAAFSEKLDFKCGILVKCGIFG